jgi:GNAT superfamily N-acetyltransferase
MGQYGRVNVIPGDPDHLVVTGAEMGIAVMDYSGDIKHEVGEPIIQSRSYDPRVFEYNGGIYLSFTVNREWEGQGVWYEVINVTEGANLIEALQGLTETSIEEKRVFKHVFGGPAALWVGATNGIGFSDDGKPRVMGFALMHGFIVHEFSN